MRPLLLFFTATHFYRKSTVQRTRDKKGFESEGIMRINPIVSVFTVVVLKITQSIFDTYLVLLCHIHFIKFQSFR